MLGVNYCILQESNKRTQLEEASIPYRYNICGGEKNYITLEACHNINQHLDLSLQL